MLVAPENSDNPGGDRVELRWETDYVLGPDQFFEITLRYTRERIEIVVPVYVQTWRWSENQALHLQADQETNRAYYWRVRAVQQGTDAAGRTIYIPISLESEERVFFWR